MIIAHRVSPCTVLFWVREIRDFFQFHFRTGLAIGLTNWHLAALVPLARSEFGPALHRQYLFFR